VDGCRNSCSAWGKPGDTCVKIRDARGNSRDGCANTEDGCGNTGDGRGSIGDACGSTGEASGNTWDASGASREHLSPRHSRQTASRLPAFATNTFQSPALSTSLELRTPSPMPLTAQTIADSIILKKFKLARSPKWPEVARAYIAAHPKCAACAETQQLNVHHIYPFHYVVLCGRPDLELDFRNLVALCHGEEREYHLLLGHLDDFESFNPDLGKFIHTDKKSSVRYL